MFTLHGEHCCVLMGHSTYWSGLQHSAGESVRDSEEKPNMSQQNKCARSENNNKM